MTEIVNIAVSNLLLDEENARLPEPQPSQQATQLALAKLLQTKVVNLASHIVDHGLNPAELPIVVATGDKKTRYKVLEGNRRILALKALETPSIVRNALTDTDGRRLVALSDKFHREPIASVDCVLFKASEEAEAWEWVTIRHGGNDEGRGLDAWDSDQKDRHRARHGKGRRPAGQVIDFIAAVDGPTESRTRIATTLARILSTPSVREKLGLELSNGELLSWYPKDEIAKGLRKVVDDLRSQEIKVQNVYESQQRLDYVNAFKRTELPTKARKLPQPVRLADLPSGKAKPADPGTRRRRKKRDRTRTSVARSDAKLNVETPRTNEVYNELQTLNADSWPNAGSVLLRVFVELSVDDYLDANGVMAESKRRTTPLAKRMKSAADHMLAQGLIDQAMKSMVYKVADSQQTIAASVTTFNQYVHNKYVMPKPSEVRMSWDELQPFLEKIWP
jgi:hypothetical protein